MGVAKGRSAVGRRAWAVAGIVVLGIGGGWLYQQMSAASEYTSSVTFYVGGPNDPAADPFSEQRMASFKGLLTCQRLANSILATAGLDMTVEQVQSEIAGDVATPMLLTATVTDPTPERALANAEAIAGNLATVIEQIEPAGATAFVLRVASGPELGAD